MLSAVMARICVMMTLFDTKPFPYDDFTVNLPIRDHHDHEVAGRLEREMDTKIKEVQAAMQIEAREDMLNRLKREATYTNAKFSASDFTDNALGKMKLNLTLGIPYLHSVDSDNLTGVVKVAIIYSCYKYDEKTGKLRVEPRLVGGFQVTVELPFNMGSISNYLYSQQAYFYWLAWLNMAPM